MEANLLTAEPLALGLGELQHGDGDTQPEADAREEHGKQAEVELSPLVGVLSHPVSISLVVVVQLLWAALLVYAAYWAAVQLSL